MHSSAAALTILLVFSLRKCLTFRRRSWPYRKEWLRWERLLCLWLAGCMTLGRSIFPLWASVFFVCKLRELDLISKFSYSSNPQWVKSEKLVRIRALKHRLQQGCIPPLPPPPGGAPTSLLPAGEGRGGRSSFSAGWSLEVGEGQPAPCPPDQCLQIKDNSSRKSRLEPAPENASTGPGGRKRRLMGELEVVGVKEQRGGAGELVEKQVAWTRGDWGVLTPKADTKIRCGNIQKAKSQLLEILAKSRTISNFSATTKSCLKESSHQVFLGMFVTELAQRSTFHWSFMKVHRGPCFTITLYISFVEEYLLSHHAPGSVLDAEDTSMNQLPNIPAFGSTQPWGEGKGADYPQ